MSEINPYEPPQTPKPLQPGQIAKRGLGVAAILMLTPVAVGIALAGWLRAWCFLSWMPYLGTIMP